MGNKFNKDTVFEVTLTAAYQTSGSVESRNRSKLALLLDYTKGDETTVKFKVEFSDDGNIWFQETRESLTGGVVTVTAVVRELTGTQKVRALIEIAGEYWRISAIGVGDVGGAVKVRYKLLE